jgi:hypothetical protein
MAAVLVIVFVAAAGFAFVVVATLLVAKGVNDERRNGTFFSARRPTLAAWLARRLVGGYVDYGRPAHHEDLNGETVGRNGR